MERMPLVVELIGPAGAGKSTLAQTLSQRSERILVGVPPPVRRVGSVPFFVKNAVLLLPTFLRLPRDGRFFARPELAVMMYLNGWHRILRRQTSKSDSALVLDQGPVFMLALLYGFGPASLRSQRAEKWWDSMFKQWADVIDMVIWLDAPDEVLRERINTREQTHIVRGKPEPEISMFLTSWRTFYRETIAKLTAHRDVTLLHVSTGQKPPARIADQILREFELGLDES